MTMIDEVRLPLPPAQPEQQAGGRPAPAARKGRWSDRLVSRLGDALLERTSRRGFLAGAAVVGAAVATDPAGYTLRPVSAYDAVCGPGSSCSSGWTAFCCTINQGKNQCPPGSFVGGWWKADGSGFCCGGARYYIDCQNSCTNCSTGCGGYNSFCQAGCHTGRCTCASGSCDQRRVSCNYFRYGQCRQDISCGGPVACRVITCAPPWEIWPDCTTTSATDNRTALHSAPCLPGQGCMHPIDQWWWDRGGPGNPVGTPVDPEVTPAADGGRKRTFSKGGVYAHPTTEIHSVWGDIYTEWKASGLETSPHRYPVSEQVRDGGSGWLQRFQEGTIYWSSTTRAVSLWGAYDDRYTALGAHRSLLGYPVRRPRAWPGTAATSAVFQKGSMYWRTGYTARPVYGAIRDRYEELDGPAGTLRMPVTDMVAVGLHKYTRFENGWIGWSSAGGAQVLAGAVGSLYTTLRGPGGILGNLVAGTADVPGGRRARFERGVIHESAQHGAADLRGAIFDRYVAEGDTGGRLGLPISPCRAVPGGLANDFERGTITWDRATGRTSVS